MIEYSHMKPEIIKALFTNLLFVVGVVVLIIGFFKGSNTLAKSVFFEQYPLESWEESRCEMEPVGQGRITECYKSVQTMRVTKKVEDSVSSVSLLVSGAVLVYFFKGFIFAQAKSKK